MRINSSDGSEGSPSPVTAMPSVTAHATQSVPDGAFPTSRGSPEGRYLAGPGKPVYRRLMDLLGRLTVAVVRDRESQGALDRAVSTETERKENHRGGDRTWLLRWLIALGILAEAGTAYVAMEVLVWSPSLAIGLSALAALIAGGMACILANRRLNHLAVPRTARILEAVFVTVLTMLRYESLLIQDASLLTAIGAAALAAIISALGLLGIEEIVVETYSFAMFSSALRVSWKHWRRTAATTHLARVQAAIEAAAGKLEQHFLGFLLKTEGLQLDEARRRAAVLKAAFTDSEA